MATPQGKIVVTHINADGKAAFLPDLSVQPVQLPGASIRRIWDTPAVPVPKCVIAPGDVSPWHSTSSVDLGFIMAGEIVLMLDGGEEKTLSAGDMFIQQATNHAWANRSSLPGRYYTFLVASQMGGERRITHCVNC
ncbi:uncharacterized protein A1O5_00905 [Cladophialophora psammophila CBS 110553]|uniref:Cupin type-2 domain-containing protein n=1 Tax=Cladophialophora psammophila CBS 110553 TaxID=1182543 RepID=W9X7F8_9EURO|nr:uncharacterized protein A1O5_00905 [Cladophialophora psammophila CBS 110553]EXJ76397.1 hypothetical protein A1O5_00905 [Cladophialophora psammophila CBS 110553]